MYREYTAPARLPKSAALLYDYGDRDLTPTAYFYPVNGYDLGKNLSKRVPSWVAPFFLPGLKPRKAPVMKNPPKLRVIPVTCLDLVDTRYLLSPRDEHPGRELVASIREYGLLHPPLVKETEPDHFIIVAGRKRTKAFLQTPSINALPCLVAPPEKSDLEIHTLLFEYISTEGSLSIIEQVAFLEKTMSVSSPDQTLPFLDKLGHKATRHSLNQLLELRNLSSAVQLALHEGIITLNSAQKMHGLSREDQIATIRIIRQLGFGGSKQQQLIQMVTELIRRRNKTLDQILTDFPAPEDTSKNPNIPQNAAALLRWLHNECSPQLTETETRFKRNVARLELPASFKVLHSPSFEDDRLTLSINFPDWQSMQQVLDRIKSEMKQNNLTP